MTKPLYRPCVGVMLLNGAGLAFVGRRRPKGPHDLVNERFEWQMPQGGVDEGEAPVDAALRELYEETNVRSVEVLAEVAEPEDSVTGEPKGLPSTLNCTVPVGVPLDDVTFAVKPTDWP